MSDLRKSGVQLRSWVDVVDIIRYHDIYMTSYMNDISSDTS